MMRESRTQRVITTKVAKDAKFENAKQARPPDAPPKAAACGTRSQGMNRLSIVRVHAIAIPFHTRPACAQADPSSGLVLVGFVLLPFVLFVPFVVPSLRALGRERRD